MSSREQLLEAEAFLLQRDVDVIKLKIERCIREICAKSRRLNQIRSEKVRKSCTATSSDRVDAAFMAFSTSHPEKVSEKSYPPVSFSEKSYPPVSFSEKGAFLVEALKTGKEADAGESDYIGIDLGRKPSEIGLKTNDTGK